jgi:DNA polymerase III delta prime subunit
MLDAGHLAATAADLEAELGWFAGIVDARFKQYFDLGGGAAVAAGLPPPPDFAGSSSAYARLLRDLGLGVEERLALILALTPHLRPRLLDIFFTRNTTFDRRFTEFGGVRGGPDGDFVPTPETLVFLLGTDDLAARLRIAALIDPHQPLARRDIVRAAPAAPDDDPMKAALRPSPEALATILLGEAPAPAFSLRFPAQRLETSLEWDDLVLHPGTLAQVAEIEDWIRHGATLMNDWGMGRVLRPGYRSLFYGPPGTGKTMTATLIGKATGRPVYRVDLSLVVSKYIGETEKNLARVFDGAQSRGWILFFDEADALFGKRGESKDAHDRYANQEVSFLLQRVETFDGIAILASNFRENIDGAFARRFESIIYFPVPRPEERAELWRRGIPAQARLAGDVDLDEIAREHALTGGAIMNAVRFAALAALAEGNRPIGRIHLAQAIRREHNKEGRTA